MNRYRFVAVALGTLLAVSLAGCSKPAAEKSAVDTAAIAAAIKADFTQLVADFNAHDAAKAVAHDGPNYVGMFHGMPNVNGPAEDLTLTTQQVADPASNVVILNDVVDVAASGDMAVVRATYTFTYTDPATKQPVMENGNWVLGYKVQPDGSWKLDWSVVSDTGPAPAN
jgi:ketosteroid isomerase-like protein